MVKVRPIKDFMARHNNPRFSYKFKKGIVIDIPEEYLKLIKIPYLEKVKKIKEVDE